MPLDPKRVEQIFTEALAKPTAQARAAYLDIECAGDPELRRRVEALMAAHESAGDFLPLPDPNVTQPITSESPPEAIGPYKLLQTIGEGGFGTVYLAEQQHPVQRRVALKVIKLGMDTKQVIARFEAERQALAMMDHEHVARVFDAGATDTGRPYFVMELVSGVPITEYCDRNNLSIEQRLQLFMQVCQAVQHAHQKGLIHRDIKPSNVLVSTQDDRPIAKVIDFGIAKATQARLTEKTVFTELRQLIGTPQYMSPEQADASLDIDTRSDVYSLGVLLYELLTGTTPFDPRELLSKAYAEIQRIIREVDPPAPSTKLSTLDALPSVAARRATEPRRLSASLRGELDWIVMKCLEKDRRRRYDSAAALAADVTHHLADEPVSAAAPSRAYRLRKFVRRNRGPVIASAIVLFVLIAGIIGTTIGLIGEARQRRLAEQRQAEANQQKRVAEAAKDEAQAVNAFLTDDVLAGASPDRLPDKAVRDQIVKAMIDPAAASVEQRFKDKPLVEAAVHAALAKAYFIIGRSDLALPHAQKAMEIRRRVLGDDHPDTVAAINNVGSMFVTLGQLDKAEPFLREAVDRAKSAYAKDDADAISAIISLGALNRSRGKLDEALKIYREAMERSRRALGDDDPVTLTAINNVGSVLTYQGKFKEAEVFVREAADRRKRVLGEDHPDTMATIDNLGLVLTYQGRYPEAEAIVRQLLERERRVLGDDHPDTLVTMNNLALLLEHQRKLDEAETLFREALQRYRRVLGDDHPNTLMITNNLGSVLQSRRKLPEAEQLFGEALARERRLLGDDHPNTLITLNNFAKLVEAQGRRAEAEKLFAELFRRAPTSQLDPQNVAEFMCGYGVCLVALGRYAEAEQPLRAAMDRVRKGSEPDGYHMRSLTLAMIEVCDHTNRPEDAAKWRSELRRLEATTHPATQATSNP
jgi:serine/threonine protein kinase/tetratricopeptide (TPR) repeat protein